MSLLYVLVSLAGAAHGAPKDIQPSKTIATSTCLPLPARLVGGRFFVDLPLREGGPIAMFTDTGGGGNMLTTDAAKRAGLRLRPAPIELVREVGPGALLASAGGLALGPTPPLEGELLILDKVTPVPDLPEAWDGMLGHRWFAGQNWTWDYPQGSLSVGCPGIGQNFPVGLPEREQASRKAQFPRIAIEIAGERLFVLFDSGATTWLTSDALRQLGDDGPAVRATSMVTATRLAAWRAAHPTWRVIEAAQERTRARMIEVPNVVIAGVSLGPVWFTERPDHAFTGMMSSMMSGPVEGAIGGNAFTGWRVSIDYPRRIGWLAKPGKTK